MPEQRNGNDKSRDLPHDQSRDLPLPPLPTHPTIRVFAAEVEPEDSSARAALVIDLLAQGLLRRLRGEKKELAAGSRGAAL